jgi:hypothetical protein
MQRSIIPVVACLLALLCDAGPVAAQDVAYAYTKIDLSTCRHTKGTDIEDYGSWLCRGHAGIPVYIAGGDQRSFVSYGRNAKREVAASETLSAFNGHGDVIEWRIETLPDGKTRPFATILRFGTTVQAPEPNPDGHTVAGQVLVITRLNPGGVCHVGYVDGRANPDANVLARQVADERARTFRCGKDNPGNFGKIGPGFSGRP